MPRQIKRTIRKIIKSVAGEEFFSNYHKALALIASNYYGNPSKKMLVVAVTGTKGKTSTLNFLWHVLTAGGYKVGLISTANIKIGNQEKMNWYHMTMPGRFLLQSLLKEMEDASCDIVLVEATSEGIKQNRHIGLYYDVAVFTNLHPEHLQSHNNSFEEYRMMKGKLFENLKNLPPKKWKGDILEKIIIANANDKNSGYFLNFSADKKYSYGKTNGDYKFTNVTSTNKGVNFSFEKNEYSIPIIGEINVYNCMPGIILAKQLGIKTENIQKGIKNCTNVPGRMENIFIENIGQDFTAIVDYAYEPISFGLAVDTLLKIKKPNNRLIVVFGGDGGGREPRTGVVKIISEKVDVGIITLSDPFDTDPQVINDFLMNKALDFGMVQGVNIFETIDRRKAIAMAVDMAKEGDILLFTCKGAEQSIIFKDHTEKWDDREEVRIAIKNKLNK
jgi:UDP-N-acetylmuramoyl-L-alanyl-D-glutamate--2,6-diaminopimelate ligase